MKPRHWFSLFVLFLFYSSTIYYSLLIWAFIALMCNLIAYYHALDNDINYPDN